MLRQQAIKKRQVSPNELWEKAKQCCNLLENSKVDSQNLIHVSHLNDQILDISQPPKPRNVYFISPHNSDTEIKQKKLISIQKPLTILSKDLGLVECKHKLDLCFDLHRECKHHPQANRFKRLN
ncbi:unnamed protein product [Paramecium sonneborni]|uniref:Uncharacterized protein n=1 Tax=Paramecium sonneborni TaxID=65129 RepID=A0A8S1RSN3_9CILI|nr:unnamed protein product [Paramecium sonneborni]